ncbi:hypothetical protein [Xenorhabdus kozodoii]|uniref:Uncharacterized protein n=1 Tax=Xenorhabdus kozodoii TaxID=351676 RepID=A0A2D0KZJ7_9GAMM|nr:hypothetical protein [Xenorhabdus kozodoii]PHM68850.1 hypothetical protein Xkoz_03618 [Xenorhabdus kozodoii]
MLLTRFSIKKRHGMEQMVRIAQENELTESELDELVNEIKFRLFMARSKQQTVKFERIPL